MKKLMQVALPRSGSPLLPGSVKTIPDLGLFGYLLRATLGPQLGVTLI
jgi:hypothetical protein